MGLTKKRKAFVIEYLQSWNASEAARRAGYSEKTAYSIGHELLKIPEIVEAIEQHVNELTMKRDEALIRLGAIARGTMADFIDVVGEYVDLSKAEGRGKLQLIKKFKRIETKEGARIEIELYDAQSALVETLKQCNLAEGSPTERVELTRSILADLPDDELDAIIEEGANLGGCDKD